MIDSEIYNEYVRKLHLLRYDNFTTVVDKYCLGKSKNGVYQVPPDY